MKSTVRHFVGQTLRAAPAPVRDGLRRWASRLLQTVPASGPPQATPVAEPPLPPDVSQAELESCFRTWSVNGEPAGHMNDYLGESFLRFLHTFGLVRTDAGRCLELGANPYFMTYLLDRYTELELNLANYFGSTGEIVESVSYVPVGNHERTHVERPTPSTLCCSARCSSIS